MLILFVICLIFIIRVKEFYENTSYIQPPRYTVYDAPQEMKQSTCIPNKDKLDNDPNVNDGYYEVPQDGMQRSTADRRDFDNNSEVNTKLNNSSILEMQQEAHVPDEKKFDNNSNVNTGYSDVFAGVTQQPASVSNESELEENSHMQSNLKVIPSSGKNPKSNANKESATVLLQFKDLWTLFRIMTIINMVSKVTFTQRFFGNLFFKKS